MIICVEGGDAMGKRTQTELLAARLGAPRFAFPDYETPAGKAILSNLKSEWRVEPVDKAEDLSIDGWAAKRWRNALVLQSLMATNRLEKMAELRDAAVRGHVVLDRYDASAIVYGTLDGLDPAWLRRTNAALAVRPDLYILLDGSVDEGFKRRPERRDRYETDHVFLERVREGYLRLFATEQARRADELAAYQGAPPLGIPPCWRTVDAIGTEDQVQERIWECVSEFIQED